VRKKEKTIMMIGGGVQQINAIKIIHSCGYKVLVTDRNKNAPCFSIADYKAIIDGRDVESLIAFALLNKEVINLAGVFTLTELVTSVAAVANACKLPSVGLENAVACQNKQLCKKIWLENKISTPKGKVVNSFNESKEVFTLFKKNIFIKPVVGFGGKESRRISSEEELSDYFYNNNEEVLIEEFLNGSMHDVNGLIDENGVFHPMGIVDRFFLNEYPVEKEIMTPSKLTQGQQKSLYDLLERSVRALGIKWGPIKGDAILVDKNFYIFEVAPRLHGPKSSLFLLPYSGFNCLEKSLAIIVGEKNNDLSISQNNFVFCTAILPLENTIFNSKLIKEWKKKGKIIEHLIFKSDGVKINKYMNSTDVPAYIFIKGKSALDCKNIYKSLNKRENYGNNIK
tara:strand:+ start:3856 stop:5046 length:1191 start_codon:yes stop_codon:yes gene_type:complete